MVTWDEKRHTAKSEYKSRGGVKVTTLQVHHMAGRSLAVLIDLMQPGGRKVSANGALGTDGHLVEVVPQGFRAFTSASAFDAQCITVETVNASGAPEWGISEASHERLGQLLADMHEEFGTELRYGVGGLIFHRDVPGTYATSCPGPSMDADKIIAYAKAALGQADRPTPSRPSAPAASAERVGRGSTGDRVRWVQERLREHSVIVDGNRVTVDGNYGAQTEAGVRQLQNAKGLQVDGWLTWGSGQTYNALAASPPAATPAPSASFDVAALQRFLKAKYPAYARHLVVDGKYGPQTAAAVREFQLRSDLVPDGIVGAQQTLPALRRAGFRG